MVRQEGFLREVCALAVPVTLQSMLQASFSIVDQVMIGQLGEASVAGVGLAGKFSSIYSVIISAIGAVAGIMISQYLGQKQPREVRRSFDTNLWIALALGAVFTALCALVPVPIMGFYIQEPATRREAAGYLRVLSGGFLPLAGATMLSTLLRCTGKPRLPLYASLVSAVLNTGLNYLLIFGKGRFPALGAEGAAIATVVSQWGNLLLMLGMMRGKDLPLKRRDTDGTSGGKVDWKQYCAMLLPILVCEVAWSLGENVYAAVYGHMGTDASAAMTLINPIQGLMTGALCGLSQAASVIVGKKLGQEDDEGAYSASKRLLVYGAVGAAALSAAVVLTRGWYVEIYRVEGDVKALTGQILVAYAVVAPFKVLNMILGGGIIRSGGKTKYVMFIDLIGTWCFGVPLALAAAFWWRLDIPYVYFLLSLEECVRFGISLVVFRRKRWMNRLEVSR